MSSLLLLAALLAIVAIASREAVADMRSRFKRPERRVGNRSRRVHRGRLERMDVSANVVGEADAERSDGESWRDAARRRKH